MSVINILWRMGYYCVNPPSIISAVGNIHIMTQLETCQPILLNYFWITPEASNTWEATIVHSAVSLDSTRMSNLYTEQFNVLCMEYGLYWTPHR